MIPKEVIVLICNNPKLSFIKLVSAFYSEYRPAAKIDSSAVIASTAILGKNCSVGPNVVIEDNVWVGRRTVVLKGVTLGNGCILGFGSIVSRSIPPHCIAAGMPARVVKENVVWAPHDDEKYKSYFPLTKENAYEFFNKTKPQNNYENRKIKRTNKLLNWIKIYLSIRTSK